MPSSPSRPKLGRAAEPGLGAALGAFILGAMPVLALVLACSTLGPRRYSSPFLIFPPLVSGLATMGLVAVAQDWSWFRRTPIARQWLGMLGERVGRVALCYVLGFFLLTGLGLGVAPLLMPPADAFAEAGGERRPDQPDAKADGPADPGGDDFTPATAGRFPTDAGYMPAALKDLRSGKPEHQRTALAGLQAADGGAGSPELLVEVRKLIDSEDASVADFAVRALGRWGTADDASLLETRLAGAKQANKPALIQACEHALRDLKLKVK